MYLLNLEAVVNGEISDRFETRFGIREFSYELALADNENLMRRVEYNPLKAAGEILFNTIDRLDIGNGTFLPRLAMGADPNLLKTIEHKSDNSFLTIKVNGVRIFCKGGNRGMDDAMKRVSRERLEPFFRLHKEENFNMIRNWTGECTERVFYELADEYGMLVWNDFWLSTEGSKLNVNDYNLFMKNAADVAKRFRNHAPIAIWHPRNEGYAPAELEKRLQEIRQSVAANKKTEAFQVEYPTTLPKVFLTRLTLLEKNKIISQNDYWKSNDNGSFAEFNILESPELTVKILEKEIDKASCQIINKGKVPAWAVKLNIIDAASGERILPAYFSDGYFNLLPGEKRVISVEWPNKKQAAKLRIENYHDSLEFDFL